MTKSITGKLIVVLTLCLAIIHGGGAYIDYQFSRDEILERVRLESRDTINGVVNNLEHWLHSVQSSTLFLARILEQRQYSPEGLNQLLRDVVVNEEYIYGATIALNPKLDNNTSFAPYYYRKDGVISYVDMAKSDRDYWRKNWYTKAVEAAKPIWIEPYFDDGGGEVLMTTFSVPVYHITSDGERILYAVVTADVALEKLHIYLQQLRLGESGRSVLISRTGVILSSDKPDSIMENYLDAMSTSHDRASWQRSFNAVLNGETLVFPIKCPARLGRCSTHFTTLASTGWPVAILYSQNEILAPVKDYTIKAVLTGLITLMLMALAISIVSRRLTRQLVALAEASKSIARGELDVPLPRAEGKDEVAMLVQSFGAMKHDLKSYIADLKVATAGRARLEGELAAATQIQMSMLPQGGEAQETTASYSLWAKVRPAKSVGGDLYTYYQRNEHELYIVVGDVSDKGVPAALFMAKAISHIQQFEDEFKAPEVGMALLNDVLEQGNDNCMFVTLFFGVLNLQSLELRFASAGHTAPSLLRAGGVTTLAQETGPALGLAKGMTYPENKVSLASGDRLAIYTDGIDEAFNEQAIMFGTDRFNAHLKETDGTTTAEAGKEIFRAVDVFVGDTPQSDDITLMLLDVFPTPSSIETSHKLSCKIDAVGVATDWLEGLLRQMSVDQSTTMELVLVTEEVLTNIQKYAKLPTNASIEISIQSGPQNIVLEFSDQGVAFNPFLDAHRALLGADIDSAEIGGLGVHLITQLTDKQSYKRRAGKNIVKIEKFLLNS